MSRPRIQLWTDGSGRSGGPIGWAYVLRALSAEGEILKEVEASGSEDDGTNNRAELLAVIHGLEALKHPADVTVISDSEYAIGGYGHGWVDGWIRRGWKSSGGEPVKNVDLWQRLGEALIGHEVSWHHVDGHKYHWECLTCGHRHPHRQSQRLCQKCGERQVNRVATYPLNERCDQLAGAARAEAVGVLFDEVAS